MTTRTRTTPDTTFWRLTVEEVQDVAKERLGRTLTPSELHQAENMFSDGIGWYDTLCIAVDECADLATLDGGR